MKIQCSKSTDNSEPSCSKTHPQPEPDATSPREVERIVSKLPTNKAPGADRITSMMLKQGPRKFNVYLAQLYNKLLQQSHFPSNWKHASICMIPKPGTD